MDFGKAYSAEGACVLGGLFFIVMGFGADLAQQLSAIGDVGGHAHGGDFFLRVNIPVMGIACIAFGLGMYIVNEHRDRAHVLAYMAGLFILTDGIAHLFAITDHITIPLHAAVFSVIAPLQVAGGIVFPFLPRKWDRYWIVFTVGMIALYVVSRSVAFPPLWDREDIEAVGVFSKAIEVVTLFPLISLVQGERSMLSPASASGAAEP